MGLDIMVYEPLYHAFSPNMVTVLVCSKSKKDLKIGCFYK